MLLFIEEYLGSNRIMNTFDCFTCEPGYLHVSLSDSRSIKSRELTSKCPYTITMLIL